MAFSNKRKNMKKLYNHISEWERKVIERLVQPGSSNKAIAAILKRSISTIGRELKRNYGYCARSYNGERAQELAKQRRHASDRRKNMGRSVSFVQRRLEPGADFRSAEIARCFCELRDDLSQDLCAKNDSGGWRNGHHGIFRKCRSKIAPTSVPERSLVIGKATP